MENTIGTSEELEDVVLCYISMGLSLGDYPREIETEYECLIRKFKSDLSSPVEQVRDEARDSLRLIDDMYKKIKDSVTYQTMLREQRRLERMKGEAALAKTSSGHKRVLKNGEMHCPKCHAIINKQSRTCPECSARIIQSTPDRGRTFLTPVMAAFILFIVLVSSLLAFMWQKNPDLMQNYMSKYPEMMREFVKLF